jgi:hypothetical protein
MSPLLIFALLGVITVLLVIETDALSKLALSDDITNMLFSAAVSTTPLNLYSAFGAQAAKTAAVSITMNNNTFAFFITSPFRYI